MEGPPPSSLEAVDQDKDASETSNSRQQKSSSVTESPGSAHTILSPMPPNNLGDGVHEQDETSSHMSRPTISKLLKEKAKEWTAVAVKDGPLHLLDLPVDILKEIIHHLPHTNDLTSLAITHSALHALAIPYIYSRFDIVWPDATTHPEPRTGVDALTYGLATLVMAEEIFGESSCRRFNQSSDSQNHSAGLSRVANGKAADGMVRRRRGNYYARFTKKFSLGNGPPDWVQEYLITKEGGKMLGTLVALAVARMRSLETFVWDMPTGVLRDVWLALSSLDDHEDGEECRLERLWIRWHDNTPVDGPPPPPQPAIPANTLPLPPGLPQTSGIAPNQTIAVTSMHHQTTQVADRVEHPTFSVIPPLRSLTVLDIDELPYLDEMSILISRSLKRLRELRVGIAQHAQQRDWVSVWEGDGAQQVDYSTTWTTHSSINSKRLGGVLGVLVGRVFNLRRHAAKPTLTACANTVVRENARGNILKSNTRTSVSETDTQAFSQEQDEENLPTVEETAVDAVADGLGEEPFEEANHGQTPVETEANLDGSMNDSSQYLDAVEERSNAEAQLQESLSYIQSEEYLEKIYGPALSEKLTLDTMELERVPLSVSIMLNAIDWTRLTALTLLNCVNHEALWKSLRRNFSPRPYSHYLTSSPSSRKSAKLSKTVRSDYTLNLKKIQTNSVSPALISFLKETLAPDSLEVLFLQEGRSYSSAVGIDSIYRGPLRRHKGSLQKLMIDSSERDSDGHATGSPRWRRWMVNREILTFMTSGRMGSLRELAITIDYRDWHFFLQRLPLIPHVRSLYIPNIADHVHGNNIDPRELALQVVDIVHLRPEIEICYMGLSTKCFEILENKQSTADLRGEGGSGRADAPGGGIGVNEPLISDDEDDDTEEDEDDDDPDAAVDSNDADVDDSESESSDSLPDDIDEDDSFAFEDDSKKGPRLRLREILFYDDKVAIFKARNGRL